MMEVYLPTKQETRGFENSPLLKDLLSKPASLKKLCRDSVRKSLRILTGGRTIRPLVAGLENSGELDRNSGDFLVCDLSGTWREKMVKLRNNLTVNICLPTRSPTRSSSRWRLPGLWASTWELPIPVLESSGTTRWRLSPMSWGTRPLRHTLASETIRLGGRELCFRLER